MKVFSSVHGIFEIPALPNDTVFELKHKIQSVKPDLPVSLQTLVFQGRVLSDDQCSLAEDYHIDPRVDTLMCLAVLAPGDESYASEEDAHRLTSQTESPFRPETFAPPRPQGQQLPPGLLAGLAGQGADPDAPDGGPPADLGLLRQQLAQLIGRARMGPVHQGGPNWSGIDREIPSLETIASSVLQEEGISIGVAMGFERSAVIRALFLHEGDVNRAMEWVIEHAEQTGPLTFPEWDRGTQHFGDFLVQLACDQGLCSFTVTHDTFAVQEWWQCRTCGLIGGMGFCRACRERCHADHDVIPGDHSPSRFYCDCGAGEGPGCQCLGGFVWPPPGGFPRDQQQQGDGDGEGEGSVDDLPPGDGESGQDEQGGGPVVDESSG